MNVDECIKTRRSIRSFLDLPIPFEYIHDIVDAGIHAPTAGNLQAFKVIVVTDDEKKLKVADACLNQTWIARAPVVLIICAEPDKLERMYGLRGKKMYSVQDCACVAQNMMLKAQELDLGTCFVSAFDNDAIRDILDIPKNVLPQIVVPLGYAAEKVPVPAKFEVRDLIFFNLWDNKDISSPWPLVKFVKPVASETKSVYNQIKEKAYTVIEKLNKKKTQELNIKDLEKKEE